MASVSTLFIIFIPRSLKSYLFIYFSFNLNNFSYVFLTPILLNILLFATS